jgi:hypothetical protein
VKALFLAVLLLAPETPVPPSPAAAAPAPRIAVEPASFDFGRVVPQRTLHRQFSIRNFGSADLEVKQVSTTCGCTAALLDNKVVKPGGSAALRVSFETRNYSGKVTRSVLIKSNDPARPTVELKLEATVTPEPKK